MQVQTVWKAGSERHDWRVFLLQTCLTLAVLLLGGALICWVAANWAGWSRLQRLTGAQLALTTVTLGAVVLLWRARASRQSPRSAAAGLLGLACVALGALLALLGQTYQTGADTWELFAAWAVLMLPWAVAARSGSVWILWMAVVNTGLALWGGPAPLRDTWSTLADLPLWMLPVNLAALAVWTFCGADQPGARRVGPRLLAAMALLVATGAFLADNILLGLGALMWAWTALPLALIHGRWRPDGAVLAMLVLSLLAGAIRLAWTPFGDYEWEGRVILTIMMTLGAGVLGHRWIRHSFKARGAVSPSAARLMSGMLLGAALVCALLVWMTAFTGVAIGPGRGILGLTLAALAGWAVVVLRVRPPEPMHTAASAAAGPSMPGTVETGGRVPEAAHIASVVLLALTAWFSAALLVGLIAFTGLWDLTSPIAVAGPALALGGVVLVRLGATSLFIKQVASALAFAGLLMLAIDAIAPEGAGWGDALRLTALSLLVYVLGAYGTMQFLAALMLALGLALVTWLTPTNQVDVFQAASALFDGPGVHALGAWMPVSVGLAALAVLLFLLDYRLHSDKRRFDPAPMAWAMALAALASAWVSAGVPVTQLGHLWALHPPTVLLLLAGALLPALAAIAVMRPLRHALPAQMRWRVAIGLLALGILWLPSPGILFALTWTLLGFGLARRGLLALGSVASIAYLCVYYYQLSVPLIDKALWLGSGGLLSAVLAVALWRAHRQAARVAVAPSAAHPVKGHAADTVSSTSSAAAMPSVPRGPSMQALAPAAASARPVAWRAALALAGLLACLAIVNTTAWQREQIVAHGRQVLLPLAPVDPRSLLQGDYMRLDFTITRDIRGKIDDAPKHAPGRDGYAIVTLTPTGEVQLQRLQVDAVTASAAEIALPYRLRNGDVRVITNAWFFPEGQADHFAQSRYGVVKADDAGHALLVGMQDENFKPL